jgi:hypothetical protein
VADSRTLASAELLRAAPPDAGAAGVMEVAMKGAKGAGPHVAEARWVAWSGAVATFATSEPIGFGDDGREELKEVLA